VEGGKANNSWGVHKGERQRPLSKRLKGEKKVEVVPHWPHIRQKRHERGRKRLGLQKSSPGSKRLPILRNDREKLWNLIMREGEPRCGARGAKEKNIYQLR